ncbi:hypothetical protein P7C73_g2764, partial [Tremellales sp. Uapishka_1]
MVEPHSRIWHPRKLARWRPRIDHVPHLLHKLASSFHVKALDDVGQDEAVNKQVWSLYHHSHQTFLSLTSQRALNSASKAVVFHASAMTKPTSHQRSISTGGPEEGPDGVFAFKELQEGEEERLWRDLKRTLGHELQSRKEDGEAITITIDNDNHDSYENESL